MRRRNILAAAGGALTTGLAGCMGSTDGSTPTDAHGADDGTGGDDSTDTGGDYPPIGEVSIEPGQYRCLEKFEWSENDVSATGSGETVIFDAGIFLEEYGCSHLDAEVEWDDDGRLVATAIVTDDEDVETDCPTCERGALFQGYEIRANVDYYSAEWKEEVTFRHRYPDGSEKHVITTSQFG